MAVNLTLSLLNFDWPTRPGERNWKTDSHFFFTLQGLLNIFSSRLSISLGSFFDCNNPGGRVQFTIFNLWSSFNNISRNPTLSNWTLSLSLQIAMQVEICVAGCIKWGAFCYATRFYREFAKKLSNIFNNILGFVIFSLRLSISSLALSKLWL